MGKVNYIHFPKIYHKIRISRHCERRMKQRASLKTKEKRKSFVRKAAKECIPVNEIPDVELFKDFISYIRHVRSRLYHINPYCKLFLYLSYLMIVSEDGVMVTILKVDKEYESKFTEIKEYFCPNMESIAFAEDEVAQSV